MRADRDGPASRIRDLSGPGARRGKCAGGCFFFDGGVACFSFLGWGCLEGSMVRIGCCLGGFLFNFDDVKKWALKD